MQALKITIPGDYWDVQIYRGLMHLWTMNGSVLTLQWDSLVNSIAQSAISSFAIRFGFSYGSTLYKRFVTELLEDSEFRQWTLQRFKLQAAQEIIVSESMLRKFTVDEQEWPTLELPVDSLIYNRVLYATTDVGTWMATVGHGTIHPISTRAVQFSDLRAVALAGRGRQIAIAALGEGLFQFPTDGMIAPTELRRVSKRHCESVGWVFQSVFGTSTVEGGFLVARCWSDPDTSMPYGSRPESVIDIGEFGEGDIVGTLPTPDVSWAYNEKIYSANESQITSSKFTQKRVAIGIESASAPLGHLRFDTTVPKPVGGGSGTFGAVVEINDGLLVIESDETQSVISGEVTRWRNYPRAINYENQLHVIFDDHIDVFGFFGDYYVGQRAKKFGAEFRD